MPPKRKFHAPVSNDQISKFFIRSVPESPKEKPEHDGAQCSGSVEHGNSSVDEGKLKSIVSKPVNFQHKWTSMYNPWLKYDNDKNVMYCNSCKELGYNNTLALGTNKFCTTTIQRHLISADHKMAITVPKERANLDNAVKNVVTKEEKVIFTCMKVVYWLAKESIPLTKYSSLVELLGELGTPHLEALKIGDNINYNSYTTACDLLESISSTIDQRVTHNLQQSPVTTIMTDESTDIVVHHKLCISARIVDPISLSPSTHFLTDLRISSATGIGIFNAINEHLTSRSIDVPLVTGLGTDGATVMTGRKRGLTGQFLRHNPHLINTHCSAHRVALCSEQAANDIPAMKFYQQTLENLFYYFKKSPGRCDKMEAVQKVLKEPVLRYREVHQVRWLSFYQALDAVYRTLDSLLSYFTTATTDDKAKGFKKKMGDHFFLYMTYAMMDFLQPIMKLSLFFQKKDVDIGCVQLSVDQCLKDLETMKGGECQSPFLQQLAVDLVDNTLKGQHTITRSSKYNPTKTRQKFVEALIENVSKRFPGKQLMTGMCVLGLRPITFLNEQELSEWGNDFIKILTVHLENSKGSMMIMRIRWCFQNP